MTLSILFVNARPKKSLRELFRATPLPMSRAKEETKSMIGNVLVVAVLVAGVTFTGVIQLPQLRDNNNSSDHRLEFNSTGVIQLPQLRDNNNSSDHRLEFNGTYTASLEFNGTYTAFNGTYTASLEFNGTTASLEFNSTTYNASHDSTYENLLYSYLFFDVGALSFSLVAALFLLLPSFHYPRFQISAVAFSAMMVCLAIFMMFGAFLCSVTIALIGSDHWLLPIIIAGVALVFASIILLFAYPIFLRALLHYIYYSLFLLFIYIRRWWLPNKLSDLKRKHNL